jgi:hypothetical protein
MKCPKCEQEMLNGFIPVLKGRLYWLPEDENLPWYAAVHPKNGIILSSYTLMNFKKAGAYYCKPCKFVILPVKD